jgi:hypothetical protein
MTMPRYTTLFMTLLSATVALMLVGAGDRGAVAGTATPDVAGTWQGTWSHRHGSGRITLQLAQEGTKVTGRQSVVSVTPLFGAQRGRRIGQPIKLGREIRDGHIEDSTLIFNVEAFGLVSRQVNFTLTVSGATMTGTVCADTCGTMKLQKSNL